MEVVQIGKATVQGPRPEMQDEVFVAQKGSMYYLGVFDGHCDGGEIIAAQTAQAIQENIATHAPHQTSLERARIIRRALRSFDRQLRNEQSAHDRGTTATVAVVENNDIAVTYVGDSEAIYYPDSFAAINLTSPHDGTNQNEIDRVKAEGYDVKIIGGTVYFAGELAVSRAVGDHDLPFVSAEAHVNTLNIDYPGTLLVASDGVWGSSEFIKEEVEKVIREGDRVDCRILAQMLVETFADLTYDNASAIVARIE